LFGVAAKLGEQSAKGPDELVIEDVDANLQQ